MKRSELTEHFIELNFMPQDACRWLSPSELKTLMSSTLALLFGNYADKRELQKVFDSNLIVMPPADQPLAEGGDFWFDYTADVGDGFEATYTVAALMGQPSLHVEGIDGALPRGQMLVLGGDQVYPTASSKAYEDRTTGPYRSAMPSASPQPLLLALPGNHDWYDGLTAFLRLFTQDRMIGGWRTEQKRSYWTVQLPHRWWLVGLDSQLDSYFDDPQLQVLRVDPHRQPPAGRQRHRLRRHAGLAQGVGGLPRRVQRPGVVRAQLRHLAADPGEHRAGAHRAPRRGSGSAATSTTTCATPSASRTRRRPRGPRGRW